MRLSHQRIRLLSVCSTIHNINSKRLLLKLYRHENIKLCPALNLCKNAKRNISQMLKRKISFKNQFSFMPRLDLGEKFKTHPLKTISLLLLVLPPDWDSGFIFSSDPASVSRLIFFATPSSQCAGSKIFEMSHFGWRTLVFARTLDWAVSCACHNLLLRHTGLV